MDHDAQGGSVEAVAKTKDGVEVVLRPARDSDRTGLEVMFRSCSPETLYTRFLSPGLAVPLRYLSRLMFHNPPHTFAIVGETGDGSEKKIVGLMNMVAVDGPATAEIAIVVADDYQNRGLGTAMLDHLYELALAGGVVKIIADVDAGNRRVFHLIQRSKRPCNITIAQGVARAEMDIAGQAA